MELQYLLPLSTLAQLPVLVQALLLHPYYRTCRYARQTRWAMVPAELVLLAWFSHEWRTHHASYFDISTNVSTAVLVTVTILRSFVFALARGPYYRLPTKKVADGSPAPVTSDFFIDRLGFATSLLMSLRGIGWSFGVPVTSSNQTPSAFLRETLERYLVNFTILLIAVFSSAKMNIFQTSHTLVSQYLMTLFIGVWTWVFLDLSGCHLRILAYILRLEPSEHPFFLKFPLASTSVSEFWSIRWHSLLRHIFIELGVRPARWVVKKVTGQESGPISRVAGVLGAFLLSGLLHEFILWFSAFYDPKLRTTIFFFGQGLGAVLESTYTRLSGKRVDGWIGRLWTWGWLLSWGRPMVNAWIDRGMADGIVMERLLSLCHRIL